MNAEQAKFEGWAVVEIMGHNREVGFVTTEYFGGPALFRVDQPPLPDREYELTRPQWINDTFCDIGTKVQRVAVPGKTVYVGPPAIFRISPCSQETVMRAVEELIPAPVKILHLVERKQIAVAAAAVPYDDPDTDIDDDEEVGF